MSVKLDTEGVEEETDIGDFKLLSKSYFNKGVPSFKVDIISGNGEVTFSIKVSSGDINSTTLLDYSIDC